VALVAHALPRHFAAMHSRPHIHLACIHTPVNYHGYLLACSFSHVERAFHATNKTNKIKHRPQASVEDTCCCSCSCTGPAHRQDRQEPASSCVCATAVAEWLSESTRRHQSESSSYVFFLFFLLFHRPPTPKGSVHLKVVHRLHQCRVDVSLPFARPETHPAVALEHPVQIRPPSLAQEIGIVRWRANAH
jgi:hypothetical protein